MSTFISGIYNDPINTIQQYGMAIQEEVIKQSEKIDPTTAGIFLGGVALTKYAISNLCNLIVPKINHLYFNPKKLVAYSFATFVVANTMQYFEFISEIHPVLEQVGNAGAIVFCTCVVNKLFFNFFYGTAEEQFLELINSKEFMQKEITFVWEGKKYLLLFERNPECDGKKMGVISNQNSNPILFSVVLISREGYPAGLMGHIRRLTPQGLSFASIATPRINHVDSFAFIKLRLRWLKDAVFPPNNDHNSLYIG